MAKETSSQGRLAKMFGISAEEHGDSQWSPDSTAELEVIGLGLSRSGTTSLREALDMLGLGPVHHGIVSVSTGPVVQSRGKMTKTLAGNIPAARPQRKNDYIHALA